MDSFRIIKKYIDSYDYYSLLKYGAPNDEFDSYSQYLSKEILKSDSIEDIAHKIANQLDTAFGEPVNYEKYISIAKNIKTELFSE